jgi:raffinose/stachyose/melibiose transport system substrate-binding protein
MIRRITLVALCVAALSALAATALGSTTKSSSEITLTCQRCEASPSDVFSQSWYDVVQAFNAKYEGKYRINVQHFAGQNENDLQYWERLALAGSLPDIFIAQATQLQTLAKTGKLFNLAPALAADPAWKKAFYPGAFESLTGSKGEIWGIPEERDTVGIYWNRALFAKAGLRSFPTTWAQFLTACKKLKQVGVIPFAMDGDWVTQLMWANLIGTRPGGAQFLLSGIKKGNWASNPMVVRATDFLKSLHTAGYVNKDAFSGDYQNAANPFLQEQAAMIANGPWMVAADIKGSAAKKTLYAQIAYAPSPGWTKNGQGVIVLNGNAGVASGTRDPAKQAAVIAFEKFATSPAIELRRTLKTGAYWPAKIQLSGSQRKQLEPVTYRLLLLADHVKYHYEHAKFATLQPFTDAWKNYWPAYVQGKLSTDAFLKKISEAAKPTVGG